jgi:uncharacterized protein YaaW (UPF0174 family)
VTVDELRSALELATEEELRELTQVLFARKFNPLDYVAAPDPLDVQSRDRQAWIDLLEQRFRFLAADGLTVLRGEAADFSYRDALVRVCHYLKLPYREQWSTMELESEIFLALLDRAWGRLPEANQAALTAQVQRSLAGTALIERLPAVWRSDPVRLMLKGGGALALDVAVRPLLLRHIAYQFAVHFARYQAARLAIATGTGAAAALQGEVVAQMARRGMALSAARYGAARTVLAVLGPALWALFLMDLGWRAIATNYGRIVPTVFALAQIRLTRGGPEGDRGEDGWHDGGDGGDGWGDGWDDGWPCELVGA